MQMTLTYPQSAVLGRAATALALLGAGAVLLLAVGPPTDVGLAAVFLAAVVATELLRLDFPDRRGVALTALPVLLAAPHGTSTVVWAASLGALLAATARRSPASTAAFSFLRASLAAVVSIEVVARVAPGMLGLPLPAAAGLPALVQVCLFAGLSEALTPLSRYVGRGTPTRIDLLTSLAVVPLALAAWVLDARIGPNGMAVAGAGLLALLVVVRSSVNSSTRNGDLERLGELARQVAASTTPSDSLSALAAGLPRWAPFDQIWLALPGPGRQTVVHSRGDPDLLPTTLLLTPEIESLADGGPHPLPTGLLPGRSARSVLVARYGKGGLLLLARRHRAFSSEEEELLRLLFGQLSATLEQIRLVDQLERAMTELKLAQAERDDFVNVMTHDLRQPLAGMLGYAQLLERGLEGAPVDPKLRRYARGIATGGERMMRMVSNLLEIARMETGRVELDPAIVALEPMVDELFETLGSQIEQNGLTVEVDIAADVPALLTAEALLRESLANLIGNAVKYTPVGGRISVRARRRGGQVEIQVSDTGIGIPADALPRIFGRFFRTGQPEVRELRGSGLGLALVKMMIEKLGGEVTVASELGQGTTFTVRIPARLSLREVA